MFSPQDQLSADMYNFASKEGDFARYYLMVGPATASLIFIQDQRQPKWAAFTLVHVWQLLEAQADYHRRSLAALDEAIPNIQLQQGEQRGTVFHTRKKTWAHKPQSRFYFRVVDGEAGVWHGPGGAPEAE